MILSEQSATLGIIDTDEVFSSNPELFSATNGIFDLTSAVMSFKKDSSITINVVTNGITKYDNLKI